MKSASKRTYIRYTPLGTLSLTCNLVTSTILETFKRDLEKDREEISTWETKQRELQLQEQESSAAIDEATRVLELQKGTGIAERAKIEGNCLPSCSGSVFLILSVT